MHPIQRLVGDSGLRDHPGQGLRTAIAGTEPDILAGAERSAGEPEV